MTSLSKAVTQCLNLLEEEQGEAWQPSVSINHHAGITGAQLLHHRFKYSQEKPCCLTNAAPLHTGQRESMLHDHASLLHTRPRESTTSSQSHESK